MLKVNVQETDSHFGTDLGKQTDCQCPRRGHFLEREDRTMACGRVPDGKVGYRVTQKSGQPTFRLLTPTPPLRSVSNYPTISHLALRESCSFHC